MSEFKRNTELNGGSVSISDNVLKTIANIATAEICGVSSLSGTLVDGVAHMLGMRTHMKGVKVEERGDAIELNLSIVVNYGTGIPEVCRAVQTAAKQAVEDMTGLEVCAVNIDVADVLMNMGEKSEK